MACHHKLTEPLETSPIPKDGELLSVREQHGSLFETVGVGELGQPQEQINIVLSLTPLRRRWHHHGVQGLALTRAVLADRRSIEATARQYGAASDREVRFTAWLFRKTLDVIAKAFGFATTTRHLPPVVKLDEAGAPDLEDPSMHADAGDIADPRLRSGHGRTNGG